jgi:hypothetical protein
MQAFINSHPIMQAFNTGIKSINVDTIPIEDFLERRIKTKQNELQQS